MPEVIWMSCHKVFPMPQVIGVKTIRNEAIAAAFSVKIAYENWVIEYTRSNPPRRVNKPIELPKSEKTLTYIAQEAVNELVNSPDLAICAAPNESPEKNPGKKIIQEMNWTIELRKNEYLISVLFMSFVIFGADEWFEI